MGGRGERGRGKGLARQLIVLLRLSNCHFTPSASVRGKACVWGGVPGDGGGKGGSGVGLGEKEGDSLCPGVVGGEGEGGRAGGQKGAPGCSWLSPLNAA